MTTFTQDIVSNIPGGETLLKKAKDIFKEKIIQFEFIKDGFEAHVEGLPYYFQVSYYVEIGWNVFLSSNSDTLEDDKETDRYYFQLEDAVDMVNASISEDNPSNCIAYYFQKLKALTEDKENILNSIEQISDKSKCVLLISLKDSTSVELGYSKTFKRWYHTFFSSSSENLVIDNVMISQYIEELDSMISSFNQRM